MSALAASGSNGLPEKDIQKLVALFNDRDIQVTQESIQAASRLLLSYYQHASQVTDLWLDAIYGATAGTVLPLLYIANDVVQTSRKKGSAYIDSFETRIKPALRIATDLNPMVVSKMKKIIKVWGDRKCYPRKTISWMNGAFNTSEKM